MTIIKIRNGVNMRLPAYDVDPSQAILLQNYDMTHEEIIEQIPGSVRYHGDVIGTNAPTAIMICYNEDENRQDVLVAVDDKILKKNFGSNEFETLIEGLTPNCIKNYINLRGKLYIAHPKDGLYEYDGISKVVKVNDIKLRDIVISKDTNRCFGITDNNELVWTDDLVDMGGVPLTWNALNIDVMPPKQGDVPERLWLLEGRLMILMTYSMWIYYIIGGETNWRPERASFDGGCIASQTVKQIGTELWFLGFSASRGRGIYGVDASGSGRLLSFDIEPFLNRINPDKIKDAVAEYVDNLYKISMAIDSSTENDYTFHLDTIMLNKLSGAPNIYGPHTYGFSTSEVLNTRKFKGEHLFARKHSDGARVFKVEDYRTQHSTELNDDGDLIPTVMISALVDKEGELDESWYKTYSNMMVEYPSRGTWGINLQILKDYENEVFQSYDQYLEGDNYSVEGLLLETDPLDYKSFRTDNIMMDFTGEAIQIKVSNYNVNQKSAFRAFRYDVKPDRRKRNVSIVSL